MNAKFTNSQSSNFDPRSSILDPIIAITPGEPAGIGPNILLQLVAQQSDLSIVAIADKNLLQERAELLNIPIDIIPYTGQKKLSFAKSTLNVLHVPLAEPAMPGKLNVKNVPYVIKTLELAAEKCLSGEFNALVTGPVNKAIINQAGVAFTGHTEFLAQLTKAPLPVMLLMSEQLKVALVTTHIPLSQVAKTITAELLTKVITVLHHDLENRFAIKQPRITVCGINPHAGENGHIGKEEQQIIIPTLEKLRQQGFNLIGPVSADTAFTANKLSQTDVVLAMFHDQGLPVIKTLGFGNIINVTLGLPIIRTSVDHGTALEIAGTGQANPSSLKAALNLAIDMQRI